MGFKLVRVDATEPCKIPLAVGTHFIGRGKFLDCHDHRVSRNHGQLEVTDDTVRITALHQNSCFFRRKCSQNTNILPKNAYVELSNGDQFGLVPGSYWYELVYCIESLVPPSADYTPTPAKIEKSTDDEPSVSGSSGNVTQIDIENTEQIHPSKSPDTKSRFMDTELQTDMPTTSPYKRSHSEDSPNIVKKVKTETQNPCVNSENQVRNLHINNEKQGDNDENQNFSKNNRVVNDENQTVNSESQDVNSESQAVNSENQAGNSEIQAINSNKTLQGNVGTSIEDCNPDEGIQDTDEVNTSESEKEIGTTLATVKTERCSQDTVKTELYTQETVKTESCSQDTAKTEPYREDTTKTEANNKPIKTEPTFNNVKTEPNSQENVNPGPSNNQLDDASASAADKMAADAAVPPAPPAAARAAGARPREKCMFGAQCYRVNPDHKAQYIHVGDPEWAERVPCPWGAACRNIRAAHWRDHDHPPRMRMRRDPNERRRGPHGVRMKRDKIRHRRRSDSADSDDSSEPIITRTRNAGLPNKKIIKDESDSEEKDPFASDDTDDWVPSDDD